MNGKDVTASLSAINEYKADTGVVFHQDRSKFSWSKVLVIAAAHLLTAGLVFVSWVHYFYAGNVGGPLWISTLFGVSQASFDAGARPVYFAPAAGWDGQFYFTQSNDPFALKVLEHRHLFDLPSYRYQRNGLPLMAWVVARLTGSEVTTPEIYFVVSFAIVGVATGLLVVYLQQNGIHPAWALAWAGYGGVIRPMIHGLPDATADSLFLICILAVFRGKMFQYSLAASLLCLCRESYAAPACIIWLWTLFRRSHWQTSWPHWVQVGLVALPGACVLGWAAYVAHATQTPFLSGSRSIPWGGLIDWPFFAYIGCNVQNLKQGSIDNNFVYSTSCACVLMVVIWQLCRHRAASLAGYALLVHAVLMSMTGWIVWEAGVGYFKNTSSIVLLGVLMLPYVNSRTLRWCLAINCVLSVHYLYRNDFHRQPYLPPIAMQSIDSPQFPTACVPIPKPCEKRARVELIRVTHDAKPVRGLMAFFHRSPIQLTLRVTNLGQQTWPASLSGDGAVTLGLQNQNSRGRVRYEQRIPLPSPMAPGASTEIVCWIPGPNWLSGKQTIRLAMIQEGDGWFDDADPSQRLTYQE